MFRRLAAEIDVADLLGVVGAALMLGVAFAIDVLLGTFVLGLGMVLGAILLARIQIKEEAPPPKQPEA